MARSKDQVWLRGNRRALFVGGAIPLLLGTLAVLVTVFGARIGINMPLRLASGILALLCSMVSFAILNQLRFPRIGFDGDSFELLFYSGRPRIIRIPVEVVEVFFGGQGDTDVRATGDIVKARNVVVRFAEREKQWHEREILPSVGVWKDGYIAIKGAWCEPITGELLKELNHRLVQAKRSAKSRKGPLQGNEIS